MELKQAQPIEVGFLQQSETEVWDQYIEDHPQGNIYHSLSWKCVTEEGLGHRPYYLRALDRAGRIVGVFPLFLVKGIFGRRLVSLPMRDRGGVLADDAQTASQLVSKAIQITRELNCKYLDFRSIEAIDPAALEGHKLRCEQNWITSRVDLSVGEERLWKSLDKDSVRWAVRKAQAKGVTADLDSTRKGMDLFYELFARTRNAMGIPPFPKRLFDAIWRHLVDKGKANLFIAWNSDIPINGMVNLLSKDAFIPAYAAPQNAWRKYYPSDFMFWATMTWAIKNGYRCYDFGADSPRQESLLWFKKKWGGVQHPMSYYYYINSPDGHPNFDSSSPTYTAVRKVWKRLPSPVGKLIGSWITRQLS